MRDDVQFVSTVTAITRTCNPLLIIFLLSLCVLPAEYSRRLEERDTMIGQLQRSKTGVCQNLDDLKKQMEEDSKVKLSTYKAHLNISV